MMYDYEFMVPTETNEEFIYKRIEQFKKFGFMKHEKFKIRLVLMASPHNDTKFLSSGWPENFDVEVVITPFTHVAQRIYWYYARILKADTAKWYVRVDEDSLTDVEGLDKNLNLMFDHEREYHICGTLNWDVFGIDETILRSLGYGHFYMRHHNHHESPPHEQEVSVTSNAAMKKMISNSDAMEYFEIRKEFADGFGDHGLCHAMRICKIYVLVVHFLTHNPELVNFSVFGGFRNHIHHVSHDKSPKIMDWLHIYNDEKCPEDNSIFLFGRRDDRKEWIRLTEDKKVLTVQGNHMIGLWCKQSENVLALYSDNEHEPIAHFNKQNDKLWTWEDWELVRTKIRGEVF